MNGRPLPHGGHARRRRSLWGRPSRVRLTAMAIAAAMLSACSGSGPGKQAVAPPLPITTPKVQSQVAQWFGEAPANPKACRYTAEGFCTGYHVGDADFYRRLAFWKTPVADCGDSRGTTCVDYTRWAQAWTQIKG